MLVSDIPRNEAFCMELAQQIGLLLQYSRLMKSGGLGFPTMAAKVKKARQSLMTGPFKNSGGIKFVLLI